VTPHRRAISSFATPSAAAIRPLAWITTRCGNVEFPAIRSNCARCSSVTGIAGAILIGKNHST
jgi:hypothetical protein